MRCPVRYTSGPRAMAKGWAIDHRAPSPILSLRVLTSCRLGVARCVRPLGHNAGERLPHTS
jgi:hypothetical protein